MTGACYPLRVSPPGRPPIPGALAGLATRMHSVSRVRQELSDVSHALLTHASDLEREDRAVTTRDLARVVRLCGRLGLVLLTHWQLQEVGREE